MDMVLWAQKWQLEFNVKKCKVMHVGTLGDRVIVVSRLLHGRKQVSGRNRERLRSLDFG